MFGALRKPKTLRLPRLASTPFRRDNAGAWRLRLPRLSPQTLASALNACDARWFVVDPFSRLIDTPSTESVWRYHPPHPESICGCLKLISKRAAFDGVLMLDIERMVGLWGERQGPERSLDRPIQKVLRAGMGLVRLEVLEWPGTSDERLIPIQAFLERHRS